MPTGVALDDARQQLFAAAERILRRDGPTALTSRAVTTEANVAKGVLHKYFSDFDAFLVDLVLDRLRALDERASALLAATGAGTVVDNLAAALTDVFGPTVMAMVRLIIARDELRNGLRAAGSAHVPVLGEITQMIAAYLKAERDAGRLRADAEIQTLAPTLVGAAHLLLTDPDNASDPAVRRSVASITATVHQV